jgi:hypothetical protein
VVALEARALLIRDGDAERRGLFLKPIPRTHVLSPACFSAILAPPGGFPIGAATAALTCPNGVAKEFRKFLASLG